MRAFRRLSSCVRPILCTSRGGGAEFTSNHYASMKSRGAMAAAFTATAAGVAAASMAVPNVVQAGAPPMSEPEPNQESMSKPIKPILSNPLGRYVVADAVEKILPSVVKIRVTILGERRKSLFGGSGGPPVELGLSYGSGFVIRADKSGTEILTNAHVVHDVTLRDGERADICVTAATGDSFPASIIACDVASDLAILQVEGTNESLPAATLADSDLVRAGEFVVAVGAPLTLGNSCSFGVISCLRRDLERTTGEDATGLPLLQTDLAINHGSSGGPLCDLDGKVLGVCSKKVEGGVEGIAFAIPINYGMKVVNELRTHGVVRKPFLGLAVISLTGEVVDDIRADPGYAMPKWLEKELDSSHVTPFSRGLIVHDVTRRGPADMAGIRKGDVIVSVDGVSTATASEFLGEICFKVSKKVALDVRRFDSGQIRTVILTPEAMDNDS